MQQTIHGHHGRKDDPLYEIRNVLRCAEERVTGLQQARLAAAMEADEAHLEVFVAWQCAQQLRRVYHQSDPATGRRLAEQIVATFASCPIPEVARLGRTLKKWRREFLAYFDTAGAYNGGTEAINGLIELHRRIARGFRNRANYRLRMLLIGGGLISPTSSKKSPESCAPEDATSIPKPTPDVVSGELARRKSANDTTREDVCRSCAAAICTSSPLCRMPKNASAGTEDCNPAPGCGQDLKLQRWKGRKVVMASMPGQLGDRWWRTFASQGTLLTAMPH